MKLLDAVAGVASVVFVSVGLCWMFKLDLLGSGLSIFIMGTISGTALAFGLYLIRLRDRIAALEERLK